MSRHRVASRRRPWRMGALIAGGAVVTAGAVGFVAVNGLPGATDVPNGSGTSASPSASAECPGAPTALRLAVSSGFADVLKDVGAGPCVTLQLSGGDGFDGAVALKKGTADVWIPDSRERAGVISQELAKITQSLAISPIVMSASPATAAGLAKSPQKPGWGMLAAAGTQGVPAFQTQDWKTSSVLLNVTDVVKDAALGTVGNKYLSYAAVANAVGQLKKGGPAAPSSAVPEGTIRVGEGRLVDGNIILPTTDGSPSLEYSWVMPKAEGAVADAAKQLLERLKGAEGKAVLAKHGFLEPGATSFTTSGGTVQRLAERPVQEDLRLLFTMADSSVLSARTTALLDVSGSMALVPPGSEVSNMDALRKSIQLFASTMPDNVVVGGWAFGYQLAPPNDYQVLLEPAPLAQTRQRILELSQTMQAQKTGTALYSTYLDAYKDAQAHYDPSTLNFLAIFTDGNNQDAPGRLELNGLLEELKKTADPAKPVVTLFFGFGEADVSGMKQITDHVGGNVWKIDVPEQIVGAMIEATAQSAQIGIPQEALR